MLIRTRVRTLHSAGSGRLTADAAAAPPSAGRRRHHRRGHRCFLGAWMGMPEWLSLALEPIRFRLRSVPPDDDGAGHCPKNELDHRAVAATVPFPLSALR